MHYCLILKVIKNVAMGLTCFIMGIILCDLVISAESTIIMLEDSKRMPHLYVTEKNEGDKPDTFQYGVVGTGVLLILVSFICAWTAVTSCALWTVKRSQVRCWKALQDETLKETRRMLDMHVESGIRSGTLLDETAKLASPMAQSQRASPSYETEVVDWDKSTTRLQSSSPSPHQLRADESVSRLVPAPKPAASPEYVLGSGIGIAKPKKKGDTANQPTPITDLTGPIEATETSRIVMGHSEIRAIPNPLYRWKVQEGEAGIREVMGIDHLCSCRFPSVPDFHAESSRSTMTDEF